MSRGAAAFLRYGGVSSFLSFALASLALRKIEQGGGGVPPSLPSFFCAPSRSSANQLLTHSLHLDVRFAYMLTPQLWVGPIIPLLPHSMDAILGAPVPFIAGFPGSSIPKDVELQAGVGVLDLDKGTFEISKGAGGEEDDELIDRDEACTAGLPGKEILLDKLGAVYSRFQGGKEPMCVRAKQQRAEVCFLEGAAASPHCSNRLLLTVVLLPAR